MFLAMPQRKSRLHLATQFLEASASLSDIYEYVIKTKTYISTATKGTKQTTPIYGKRRRFDEFISQFLFDLGSTKTLENGDAA